MDLTLRPKKQHDEEFLFSIYAHSRSLERNASGFSTDQWDTFVRQQFNAQKTHYEGKYPKANYHILMVDGEACGRFYVDRRPDEIRVLDLNLLPRFCAQGIGTKLIEDLCQEARKARLPVNAYVHKYKLRTIHFYSRLGFTPGLETDAAIMMTWKDFRIIV